MGPRPLLPHLGKGETKGEMTKTQQGDQRLSISLKGAGKFHLRPVSERAGVMWGPDTALERAVLTTHTAAPGAGERSRAVRCREGRRRMGPQGPEAHMAVPVRLV